MGAAAWFTRRLEAICDRLELSAGVLSVLGALGANIPNYVASIDAISHGSTEVGLGIIVGSNVYNSAIILGLATFASGTWKGLSVAAAEGRQANYVGGRTLAILCATLVVIWLLPQHISWSQAALSAWGTFSVTSLNRWLLLAALLLELGLFAAFIWHIVHRPHPEREEPHVPERRATRRPSLARLLIETLLALILALGGVIVMVQSGQDLTSRMHMAPALAGLLVLAVATSLPNTVVAIILVRTGRAAACVEEVFSSNSVNAALGIALPLLFWYQALQDQLLLLLDAPLMVLVSLWTLLCIKRGGLHRLTGALLLLCYLAWVVMHLLLH